MVGFTRTQILLAISFWVFSLCALEKEQIVVQSQRVDWLLERYAHKIINEEMHNYILSLREALYRLSHTTNVRQQDLLKLHAFIVDEMNHSVFLNIKLPYAESEQLVRQVMRSSISADEDTLYYGIEEKIEQLAETLDTLNREPLIDWSDQLNTIKRYVNPLKIADMVWPYALLGVHWVLATPEDKIIELFWEKPQDRQNEDKVRNAILALKQHVGGIKKKEKIEKKIPLTAEKGIVNKTLLDWMKPIVSLELDNSLFKIGIPMLVKDRILSDMKALYKLIVYSTGCCKKCLFGKSDIEIVTPVLSENKRTDYINYVCHSYGIPASLIDRSYLSHVLTAATQETINTIFSYALRKAHNQQRSITMDDIEEALDIFVRNVEIEFPLQEQEKERRAAYYAGLLLVHNLLYPHNSITRVTVFPVKEGNDTRAGKLFVEDSPLLLRNKNDYLKACMYILGPAIAQEMLLGESDYDTLQEAKKKAIFLLEPFVLQGDEWFYIPEKIKQTKLETLYEMIEQCKQQIYIQLLGKQETLRKISQKLKKHMTLNREQITRVLVS